MSTVSCPPPYTKSLIQKLHILPKFSNIPSLGNHSSCHTTLSNVTACYKSLLTLCTPLVTLYHLFLLEQKHIKCIKISSSTIISQILPWNHSFDSFFHNVSLGLEGANVCAIIYNENTFLESQASLIYLNFLPWCLLFS